MKNNIDKDDLKNQKKQCTTKSIANWAERFSFKIIFEMAKNYDIP